MNTLTISLDDGKGKMILNLQKFFPCKAMSIRDLDKKCIRSDAWNNDRGEILLSLIEHLKFRLTESEDEREIKKLQKNYDTILKLL